MKYKTDITSENSVDMGEMENSFFLIGLLNEFMNRFQSVGDTFFGEISWKQCFVLICIRLFEQPPTLKELSDMMGTSHQNVKQMLLKLSKLGYVEFVPDEKDKRKQRILATQKAEDFSEEHDAASTEYMGKLFEHVKPQDLQTTVNTLLQLDEQLKWMQQEDNTK